MVVKEALACGLPVVSVPVGDVPEILRDVPLGGIVPPEPKAVADRLWKVLRAPRKVEAPSVLQEHELGRVAARVEAVYKRLRVDYANPR